MNIDSSTILITGASQGIGRQLAIHFAKKGAEIMIAARNRSKLDETAALINAEGGRVTPLVLDLCNLQTIQALANDIQTLGKPIDILINNAADCRSKPLLETSLEEIDAIVRTNVIGCFQLCRLIAPMMIEQGHGAIANVSSLAGYNPNPAQTVYSTSKAAVNAMSQALRAELAPQGIKVINIALEALALGESSRPGQLTVEQFAQLLESAIVRNEPELFLSQSKKWLMRLYKFWPALPNLRRSFKSPKMS